MPSSGFCPSDTPLISMPVLEEGGSQGGAPLPARSRGLKQDSSGPDLCIALKGLVHAVAFSMATLSRSLGEKGVKYDLRLEDISWRHRTA